MAADEGVLRVKLFSAADLDKTTPLLAPRWAWLLPFASRAGDPLRN